MSLSTTFRFSSVAALLGAATASVAVIPQYRLTVIPNDYQGRSFTKDAVNAHGQVVGYWFDPVALRMKVVQWDEANGTRLLPTPDNLSSAFSADINDSGQVVFASGTVDWNPMRTYVTSLGGAWRQYGFNNNERSFVGTSINESGQVSGFYATDELTFVYGYAAWNSDGSLVETVSGHYGEIEDSGRIVGSTYGSSQGFGFYRDPGQNRVYIPSSRAGSQVTRTLQNGDLVVYEYDQGFANGSFSIWNASLTSSRAMNLPPDKWVHMLANGFGVVEGSDSLSFGADEGFFTEQDGFVRLQDRLASSDWAFLSGKAVSFRPPASSGVILGTASMPGFVDSVDFLLTPVPEPATLTALGLGTLALLRHRRKR